jgi:cyclopropane-fatty-acyl-phospholipid synthase
MSLLAALYQELIRLIISSYWKIMAETWMQSYARTCVLQALERLQHGRLTITITYQEEHTVETFGEESTDEKQVVNIAINSPHVWGRLAQAFALGFAEAYMLQEINCDDLLGLFFLYMKNKDVLGLSGQGYLHRLVPSLTGLLLAPTNGVSQSKKNASFHYDTSNDHFRSFLSPDMNYSSAIWSGDDNNETLESAQMRKVHTIIRKARISSEHHVLDIGCGWGGLAIEAVKATGCRVTGLTLAAEQKALAEERIKAAGLQDRITILLCDYRNAPKPENGYDRIVSVEMLEHVGDKFMNQYFESISKLLNKKGGIMVVQGITIINPIYDGPSNVGAFLDRYIFPGGYLPTVNQLLTSIHAGSHGQLEVETVQSIGPHYIRTLQRWRENFLQNWDAIKADFVAKHSTATEGEIEAFRRKWVYYFTYCEAGFRTRMLGDHIISAVRTPELIITDDIVQY